MSHYISDEIELNTGGHNTALLLSTVLESSSIGPSSSAVFASCTTTACHSFPVRLFSMLDDVEKDGCSYIVSWQPHGRSLRVHNQEEFVQQVLPRWFRQSKFASFRRQLNLYGFQRISTGRDKGAYYHEFFLRGKPALCYRIHYIKVKGRGYRKPSSPEMEPNFYDMPFLLPSNATQGREQQGTTPVEMVVGSNHQETFHFPINDNNNSSTSSSSSSSSSNNNKRNEMGPTSTQLLLAEDTSMFGVLKIGTDHCSTGTETRLDQASLLEPEQHWTYYNVGEAASSSSSSSSSSRRVGAPKNKSWDTDNLSFILGFPSPERQTTTITNTGTSNNNTEEEEADQIGNIDMKAPAVAGNNDTCRNKHTHCSKCWTILDDSTSTTTTTTTTAATTTTTTTMTARTNPTKHCYY